MIGEYYTTEKAARKLGVTVHAIKKYTRQGKLKPDKVIHQANLYHASTLARFAQQWQDRANLTVKEAASTLGISTARFRDFVYRRKLIQPTGKRRGNRHTFSRQAVEALRKHV